jgi:hypothetical protein
MQETKSPFSLNCCIGTRVISRCREYNTREPALLAVPVQQVANMNSVLLTRKDDIVTPCR